MLAPAPGAGGGRFVVRGFRPASERTFSCMNNLEQGDLGEASARCWYELYGYVVLIPTGRSPDYDFVADDGERLVKVQVKTSGSRKPHGHWSVAICTRGGNQSWNKIVKRFSATRCDELCVATVDGRRWRMPAEAVEATTAISLGGAKYAEFEVAAGPPLGVASTSSSLPLPTSAG